ncbi:MAG: hypothetical protein ABW298_01730 [Candidatus Binatia bacterium]
MTLGNDGFEMATITRTAHDGLARVFFRTSWSARESVLVEGYEAELLVLERRSQFHRKALGYAPSWESYTC